MGSAYIFRSEEWLYLLVLFGQAKINPQISLMLEDKCTLPKEVSACLQEIHNLVGHISGEMK